MPIPDADDMANAIDKVFNILNNEGIIQNVYAAYAVTTFLRQNKSRDGWSYIVDRNTAPIIFQQTIMDDIIVEPQITSDYIQVNRRNTFPYTSWNIALEVKDEERNPISRWHFDLANEGQDGPTFHMQCGGRSGTNRADDVPIRVPRWPCPAIDLVLLAEIVTANFYPEAWLEIRKHKNWRESIYLSQRLCFEIYNEKFIGAMQSSRTTVLKEMWCNHWR
jgi:hypothetical protein